LCNSYAHARHPSFEIRATSQRILFSRSVTPTPHDRVSGVSTSEPWAPFVTTQDDHPHAGRPRSGMKAAIRRGVPILIATSGWCLVGVALLVSVFRWARVDGWWVAVATVAIAPWTYVPLYPLVPLAYLARQRALLVCAAVLALVGTFQVLPQWLPVNESKGIAAGAVDLKFFDANIQYTNSGMAGIAREINDAQPDVVTLEELSPVNLRSLAATGALARYRWTFVSPDTGADGFGVWSDTPLSQARLWFAGPHPEVSARLGLANGANVQLYVVHTDAPRSGAEATWRRELAAIATRLRGEPSPLIVVGDFNATWDMDGFKDVLRTGLSDAAIKQGKGWQMTWSRKMSPLPPLVRIDHLLYSPGITSTSYKTGIGNGSDHRPIVVGLAVDPTP
jgi:endonuclease/exonuclease/phosphatase (EEP) superfamily protein YafD